MQTNNAFRCCFHCDLIYEAQPLPTFALCEPAKYESVNDNADVAIPESPLFCPGLDFRNLLNEERCSSTTCGLLRDMRDLTDLFLAQSTALEPVGDATDVHVACSPSNEVYYKTRVAGICDRLANLPSAYTPDHPNSCDWVYEACRLSATIYTTSIVRRLPFSVAATSSRYPFCVQAGALNEPYSSQIALTTHICEELMQTLERTDLANVWNDMVGVLYWICTVGAAAARSPRLSGLSQRLPYSTTCKFRVRQCLTMFSVRAHVILIFNHPIPILLSQKKLLRVQELIGTYRQGRNTKQSPGTSLESTGL